jgi:hypothetical protein
MAERIRIMRIFLVPLFAGLLCAQAPERVQVISAGRGWFLKGRPPSQPSTTKTTPPSLLARGTRFNQGDHVTGNPAAGELIVDCPKQGWKFYFCNDQCDRLVCDAAEPEGPLQKLKYALNYTEAFLRREPKEGVTLGVRSGGNPADAVLLQNAQGVHWGPALNRVIEGSYCLRLNPLPAPARPAPQVFPLAWDRDTDPEGVGQPRSLLPGLYTLDKGAPGAGGACNVDPDETAAWVLIAVETQFAQLNAQWKERATDLAQLERAGVPPSVMANLRHAILAALADGVMLR